MIQNHFGASDNLPNIANYGKAERFFTFRFYLFHTNLLLWRFMLR